MYNLTLKPHLIPKNFQESEKESEQEQEQEEEEPSDSSDNEDWFYINIDLGF